MVQRDQRVWVVQHRNATGAAVVIVVTEADGVADFVRGELPDPGERPLGQLGRCLVTALVW